MGERLLPAEDRPAAQFMYETDRGERLSLYLRSGVGGETRSADGAKAKLPPAPGQPS